MCYLPIRKHVLYFKGIITPQDKIETNGFQPVKSHISCWQLWQAGFGEWTGWVLPDSYYDMNEYLLEKRR